jgi:anti-anti-sigma regulatory factor
MNTEAIGPFIIEHRPGVIRIGILPIYDRANLHEALFAAALHLCRTKGVHSVLCDLSQTGIIDSAVIASIARWRSAFRCRGIERFLITNASPRQLRTLQRVPTTEALPVLQ